MGAILPYNALFLVSDYIREASVVAAVESIAVSCSVEHSEPPLICRAVFYCANSETTTLNLSSSVFQNFMTTQSCNVTIQVVPSNNISRVLQEASFYNVSPSEQPTSPPSTTSTTSSTSTPSSPNSEYYCITIAVC